MELDYSHSYVDLKNAVDKLHTALLAGEWESALTQTDGISFLCRTVRAAVLDHLSKEAQTTINRRMNNE